MIVFFALIFVTIELSDERNIYTGRTKNTDDMVSDALTGTFLPI